MKNKQLLPSLSLFYPAYNEAGNIEEAVKQALQVLPTVAKKFEIIVINDGSKDATLTISKRLAKRYAPVRVITQKNRGYGGALKRGFKTAKYEWIFFTDSDLQFDLSELQRFIPHTRNNKIVIGYRKQRAEGKNRQMLATMLKIWSKVILGFPSGVKDIDCAFKLIHKSVLNTVGELKSDGAMVSTEFLLKTHLAGFTIKQLGVTHQLRMHGTQTGNNPMVIAKAIKDTFVLKQSLVQEYVMQKQAQLASLA
ncbi:MAG: glycosyltransferase family 2 protein [Candidatus Pacebacteria bacterium]|nr:glycosyltransferase family 2 protein [Candidatus Paceibacterota bacterium]PIR64071.1 MAG: glycosyltransferase family 2 protein [Candidatus Pacebacteria bacterium CG10_big_fil_rev_8_21_14_0_10_40_26]PIZ78175.1 MAG: glycosyltransferase family 2 protein [Candidatus Pacebacteria bacterium CG_4_10_14_0_2_um_filter_40_20]PJA69147.1 MAG: glycosyltransferase family 2 protein [Candidatus Pacebacteria bacterium CG_4_9_14_3_um_filter_40_12]PJC41720.1 MAG: glycosyltransferase family 2 protein [Candidatu